MAIRYEVVNDFTDVGILQRMLKNLEGSWFRNDHLLPKCDYCHPTELGWRVLANEIRDLADVIGKEWDIPVHRHHHTGPILMRYNVGDSQSMHTDRATSAISFTLEIQRSLSGGRVNLIDQEVLLSPGDLLVFPSITPHEITPVTEGTRISFVQWVHRYSTRKEADQAYWSNKELSLERAHKC